MAYRKQGVRDATDLAAHARGLETAVTVRGPAPAPLGKLRGEYRVQFLVKGSNRRQMREALLAAVAGRRDLSRRTTIDVDPLSVL